MTPSTSKEDDGKSRKWQSLVKPLHLFPKSDLVKRTGSSYIALFRPLQDLQSRFILVSAIVLAIASGAPLPIIGVIFSKIINSFPPTEDEIRKRVYQLLAVAIAYFVVTWGWAFCWGIVGARISRSLRTQMVDRALGLDQTYFETICPDITSRLTVDASTVQSGTAEKVGLFLQSVSYFLATFVVGFILNARLTGILIAGIIPSMAVIVITGTAIMNRFSNEAAESTTAARSVAEGAIHAVQVVQAFDAFDPLITEHENHLTQAMKSGTKKSIASAMLLGSVFFIAFSANALAFFEGSKIIRESASTGGAGTVYAIVFLILDAAFVIGQAGPFIQSFSQAANAGRRILSLIDYPKIPIDVYAEGGIHADETSFEPGKEIVFSHASFAYPARPQETVLNDIQLKIRAGSSVGIVGASGSGKSTIAALLLRLYDPSKGSISIDGHLISDFNISSLRSQIALVDQDPAVFSGTIYTNIRDGLKRVCTSEEEMRERCINAAKVADAWMFIESLPNGIDTWLGEPNGTKLSGGQKQRLCLARALVGNPSLLILDEATSALDAISEASILGAVSKSRATEGQTTLMIAHRLASVRDADNIVVMGKGRVLEQGSHRTLMRKIGGPYRQLVEAQDFDSEVVCGLNILEKEHLEVQESLEREVVLTEVISPVDKALVKPISYGTFTVIRRCLALSRARLFFTILALVGTLITGALILGESIIFGYLVELLNGFAPPSRVNFFCLMFFVVALAAFLGYFTSGTCFGIVSEHLVFRTRGLSLRTILRQDMDWFLQPGRSTSALISVMSMDSGHLSGLSGVIIGTIVSALVSVIGGAILAHIVAWKIAIVLFATSPIVILAGFFRLRVLSKLDVKNQQAYTEAATLATEACGHIRTIAALGTEKATSKKFHEAVDRYREQSFRDTAFGNLLLAFALAITYFVYALAYWWGAKQVRDGDYTTRDFFMVLPAILFSAQAAGQIFSLAPDIGRARNAASRVFALHDQRPTIDAISNAQISQSPMVEGKLHPPAGSITFQNVGLMYQSRPDAPLFKNLNLTIKPGETVALVGRSGAGKSSTISLIERFYDPTSGAVLLDGIDIRSVPVSHHRARISLVSQDPDLFSGSVAFNVGLGARPGHAATRDEVIAACKAVGIHDFVVGLPDGYETQCGINGSQLSGGQKQRVAIARAYIRDPEILLLDEATSALDSHSEAQIQAAISAASRKRTTIMVAHRLTTVQKADRILVFDQGQIVEEGRHEQLVRGGGIYEQMVKAQRFGMSR